MHKITASLGALLLSIFVLNSMAEQTIEYQYDELGRLTFVKDNVNGNRDYDYDPAGNRTSVAVGSEADNDVSLVQEGQPEKYCIWSFSWQSGRSGGGGLAAADVNGRSCVDENIGDSFSSGSTTFRCIEVNSNTPRSASCYR